MELTDLEKIWKATDNALSDINEPALMKTNYNNAKSEFDKLLKLSVLGRNLALVYCITSLLLAYLVHSNVEIVSAGLAGALGMLLSFAYHFGYTNKLKKLNYYSLPIIDLQKAINEFRIKSVNAGMYDLFVVLLWIATLLPMLMQFFFNKNLYAYFQYSLLNWLILALVLLLLFVGNKKMYKRMYHDKLSKAEADLKEILEFKG